MKNLFFVSIAFSIFSGTSLSAFAQPAPEFIQDIELSSGPVLTANEIVSTPSTPVKLSVSTIRNTGKLAAMATENCSRLQFKFAQILEREVETLTNVALFSLIDEWWATRYRYGGTTKAGIDCSAFVGMLMSSVYGFKLPRTAREQYAVSEKIRKEDMLEGDMVFFNTRGGVSHVGVYLGGGYFVHASVSNGVTISNLDEGYYAGKFIGAARAVDNGVELAKLK